MLAAPFFKKSHRILQRPGFFVWALGSQRIKHIGDRNDASVKRNIFPFERIGITGSVIFLMVTDGNFSPGPQNL